MSSPQPFADLHPMLWRINKAIYALWKIPLPSVEKPSLPSEQALPAPTSAQDLQPTPIATQTASTDNVIVSPAQNQNSSTELTVDPEVGIVVESIPDIDDVPATSTVPFTLSSDPLPPIRRLHKMRWCKAKSANCPGRRRLKRCIS